MLQYTPKTDPEDAKNLQPFSHDEAQQIHHMLRRKLGPEHVSTRQGIGGMRLSYIEGWRIISIANEVFGFNGWRSNIQNLTIDYVDIVDGGRFSIGASCVMRITLRDGTYREDVGFGMVENTKSKGQALEKVRKEAVTDGLKRAMRQFGNVLGNCVYDKDYLRNMGQVQKQPRARIQGDSLYRYTDLERQDNQALGQASSAATADTTSNFSNETNGEITLSGTNTNENSNKRQACESEVKMNLNQAAPVAKPALGNGNTDFDMDYMYDDVLDMMVDLETDRPIIPDSPSSGYVNDMPATDMRRNIPSQTPQTPSNILSAPMSTVSSVDSRNTPGSAPRQGAPLFRGEGALSSARNLSFEAPPQPPQKQQQNNNNNNTSVAVAGRPKSFADVSSFTPASRGNFDSNINK
ncbi:DNA repair protein rad52 [Coemansia sp. RSA 1646]|nr:DNA repair protein rad52 [Coemansia sp. RSA 1646]KAJ2217427.1 DNA repair protein rad52 [Coemansia sp. RSA 487]